MTMIVMLMNPMYVKKVDSKEFILKSHRGTAILAIIYAVFIAGFKWFLTYSLKSRGIAPFPQITETIVWGYIIASLILSVKLFLEEPDYISMNRRISSYKSEQMVKTELVLGPYYKTLVIILFLGIVLSLMTIVWPVYSTISQMSY